MGKILLLFKKFSQNKLLQSLLITGILIGSSQIALADYKPPPKEEVCEKKDTCRSTGVVSRGGCSANKNTFLTALAPKNHVGKTVTTRPTWAWFVPDEKAYHLRFQLYKYEVNDKPTLIWEQNLKSQPGIMTLTLPEEQPELLEGERYRWKVIILCNPNRPSSSLVTEADLEVIPLNENLKNQLATTTEPIAIADLLAEAGIWYDAFYQGILVTQSTTRSRFELKLLEDLAQIEEIVDSQNNREDSTRQSYRLRQVIEAELEKSSLSILKL